MRNGIRVLMRGHGSGPGTVTLTVEELEVLLQEIYDLGKQHQSLMEGE